jgi:hypothetical protein
MTSFRPRRADRPSDSRRYAPSRANCRCPFGPLVPQPVNALLERVTLFRPGAAPCRRREPFHRYQASRIGEEQLENARLERSENDSSTVDLERAALEIEHGVVCFDDLHDRRRAAPEQRLYAGDQHSRAERLLDVVVRAGLERSHDIRLAIARAQHNDRRAGAVADLGAHGKAVGAGHVDVEQCEVEAFSLQQIQRRPTVLGGDDAKACVAKCERGDRE